MRAFDDRLTGDIHEKSDLDLMILINDDAGWQLADGFILDDKKVGYDIYCTNWRMLEDEADCRHAHLAKLMDSELVYVADESAVRKISQLQSRAVEILNSGKRFERVDKILNNAKQVYAEAMLAGTIAEIRVYVSYCICLLLEVVVFTKCTKDI